MIYTLYMLKRRKILIVAILLFVHLLLIFHEVALNRVMCCKRDGSMDFELAFFNFKCFCKYSNNCAHDYQYHAYPYTLPQIHKQSNTCCDKPLNGGWLVRDIADYTEEILIMEQCDLNFKINLLLEDAFGCFFKLLPLRKFLNKDSTENNNVVLRC